MRSRTRLLTLRAHLALVGIPGFALLGCDDDTAARISNDAGKPAFFAIGGTVSGLDGIVALRNNGSDELLVENDGSFSFATEVEDGSTYEVTVAIQPTRQRCAVSNGMGTVDGVDVASGLLRWHVGGRAGDQAHSRSECVVECAIGHHHRLGLLGGR